MQTIFLLVVNYLIVTVWLWIAQQLFPSHRGPGGRLAFLGGILIASWIGLHPALLRRIDREAFVFSNASPVLTVDAFLLLLASITLFRFIISVIITKGNVWKHTGIYLFVAGVCALLYILLDTSVFSLSALYFLGAAIVEELGKFFTSQTLVDKDHSPVHEGILFALLVALGFAFLENCLYLRFSLSSQLGILDQLREGVGILVSRGAVGFLIHGVFTGSIAYCVLMFQSKLSSLFRPLAYLAAFLVGVVLHGGWNILLVLELQRAVALFVIGCYFLLTYLLYQSETIYLKERLSN